MPKHYLAIYLNDHLAGAQGALDLLAHLEKAQAGTSDGEQLAQLHQDIEADRQALAHLMERLDIAVSGPRRLSGWVAAQAAYMKLQLDDRGSGALMLFEGLEGLSIGIAGKLALWHALAAAAATIPELQGVDYPTLLARAEDQRTRVESLRLVAAISALRTRD